MNYAEDRLDRRVRYLREDADTGGGSSEKSSLAADYRSALEIIYSRKSMDSKDAATRLSAAHELLGRTLRDVGQCRQAVYHYAMAWMWHSSKEENDKNTPVMSQRAGDYAQMAELAGFPDVGALALLYHRSGGPILDPPEKDSVNLPKEDVTMTIHSFLTGQSPLDRSSSLLQPRDHHCGCGSPHCGSHHCFLPMSIQDLKPVLVALDKYQQQYRAPGLAIPTAHEILGCLAPKKKSRNSKESHGKPLSQSKNDLNSISMGSEIPPLLQFWRDNNDWEYRPLDAVLILLLLKLLYVTFPSLAAQSLVEWEHMLLHKQEKKKKALLQMLARDYKSHHAYYVLIRAVVLGERIKPHRWEQLPYHHVPVWNVLWNTTSAFTVLDVKGEETTRNSAGSSTDSSAVLRERLDAATASTADTVVGPSYGWLAAASIPGFTHKPLFVVGDSHVLSLAWQRIHLVRDVIDENGCDTSRQLVPLVVTGLKAWHCRDEMAFFTNTLLHTCLQQLCCHNITARTTVLLSAGEIDCREGLGGQALEGYQVSPEAVESHARRTVEAYVDSLLSLSRRYNLQILVLPVAPHAHRSVRNGKSTGRAFRRVACKYWNADLRQMLPQQGQVFFLDYASKVLLQKSGVENHDYVLDPLYNADYTHMNSAFLPHLKEAIQECGCDMSLL